MARHILIVEKSVELRRELQAKLLAILDDIIISETDSADQALRFFERGTVHLVMFGVSGADSRSKEFVGRFKEQAPVLALLHDEADAAGGFGAGVSAISLPCPAKELGAAVNRACNPVCLRKDKRHSIPGANGVIEQGSRVFEINILNISGGGMLCEFPADKPFDALAPVMISARLPLAGGTVEVDNLYSVVSGLKVIERNSDYSPARIRVGFTFIIVPDEAARVFEGLGRATGE